MLATACHAASGMLSPNCAWTSAAMSEVIFLRIAVTVLSGQWLFRCALVSPLLPHSGHLLLSLLPALERYSFVAHSACVILRLLVSSPALFSALRISSIRCKSIAFAPVPLVHFLLKKSREALVRAFLSSAPLIPAVSGKPSIAT